MRGVCENPIIPQKPPGGADFQPIRLVTKTLPLSSLLLVVGPLGIEPR